MEITGVEEEEDLVEEEGPWCAIIVECRATILEISLNLRRLAHIANKSTMWSNVCHLLLDGKPEQLEHVDPRFVIIFGS